MTSEEGIIKKLPLTYKQADSEISARKIIFEVNQHWETEAGPIVIHRFTEGIMNTVCS